MVVEALAVCSETGLRFRRESSNSPKSGGLLTDAFFGTGLIGRRPRLPALPKQHQGSGMSSSRQILNRGPGFKFQNPPARTPTSLPPKTTPNAQLITSLQVQLQSQPHLIWNSSVKRIITITTIYLKLWRRLPPLLVNPLRRRAVQR